MVSFSEHQNPNTKLWRTLDKGKFSTTLSDTDVNQRETKATVLKLCFVNPFTGPGTKKKKKKKKNKKRGTPY